MENVKHKFVELRLQRSCNLSIDMDFRGSRVFTAPLKYKRYIKGLPLVLSLIFFLAIISQFSSRFEQFLEVV